MTNTRILTVILALVLVVGAVLWFGRSTEPVTSPAPAVEGTDPSSAESTGQTSSTTEPAPTAETEPDVRADTQSNAAPEFDEGNWTCTLWDDGPQGEPVCLQWSARRAVAPVE